MQHLDVYLETTKYPIEVFTDHNPLTFLHKTKNKNQRLMRWSLSLQEFHLNIQLIRGKDDIIAGAPSRVNLLNL
uniref:Reverse transcriptase RNase H-like domain-containing protein n=1 Tax=Octopus bimaculoides TaxID=37653 RepID=A0A0L8GKD0_OCTBM